MVLSKPPCIPPLEKGEGCGIPLRLASLAASPLRFAKGEPPLSVGRFTFFEKCDKSAILA